MLEGRCARLPAGPVAVLARRFVGASSASCSCRPTCLKSSRLPSASRYCTPDFSLPCEHRQKVGTDSPVPTSHRQIPWYGRHLLDPLLPQRQALGASLEGPCRLLQQGTGLCYRHHLRLWSPRPIVRCGSSRGRCSGRSRCRRGVGWLRLRLALLLLLAGHHLLARANQQVECIPHASHVVVIAGAPLKVV
jgi:hypothetical protein